MTRDPITVQMFSQWQKQHALRPFMPKLRDLLKHRPRRVWVHDGEAPRGGHVCTLSPWHYGGGGKLWWSLVRTLSSPQGDPVRTAARLYVNGAGTDHELRFRVLSYHRRSWKDQPREPEACTRGDPSIPIHGAANSFCYVPGLVVGGSRLGFRGLYQFQKAEAIVTAAWADQLLDLWYPMWDGRRSAGLEDCQRTLDRHWAWAAAFGQDPNDLGRPPAAHSGGTLAAMLSRGAHAADPFAWDQLTLGKE